MSEKIESILNLTKKANKESVIIKFKILLFYILPVVLLFVMFFLNKNSIFVYSSIFIYLSICAYLVFLIKHKINFTKYNMLKKKNIKEIKELSDEELLSLLKESKRHDLRLEEITKNEMRNRLKKELNINKSDPLQAINIYEHIFKNKKIKEKMMIKNR